jgi:hypothetical protein
MALAMISIIMMVCIIGIIGGITALLNSLGKRKFKKAFICLSLIIACGFILQLAGKSDLVKNKLEQEEKQKDKEAKEEEVNKLAKNEEQEVTQDPKDITKAECEQIKHHMTYEEVRQIATYDAEITSSEQIGDGMVQHAVWTNSDGSILEVVMKNNIVTNWWGVCERK